MNAPVLTITLAGLGAIGRALLPLLAAEPGLRVTGVLVRSGTEAAARDALAALNLPWQPKVAAAADALLVDQPLAQHHRQRRGAGGLIGGGRQGVDAGCLERAGCALDAMGDEGDFRIFAAAHGKAVKAFDADSVVFQGLLGKAGDKACLAAELGFQAEPVDQRFDARICRTARCG